MATKKTTKKNTKKKEEKVYTAHEPFNLEIKTEAQANELIAHIEILKGTAGWHILKQILEGNMAVIERAIVTKNDPVTSTPLTNEQCDEMRFKHAYLEELVGKPDELIALFRKQVGMEIPTYDPYATDTRQFRRGSQVGAPMARTLTDE